MVVLINMCWYADDTNQAACTELHILMAESICPCCLRPAALLIPRSDHHTTTNLTWAWLAWGSM